MKTELFNALFVLAMGCLFAPLDFITGRKMKPWWPTKSIYLTAPLASAILALAAWGLGQPVWPWVGLGIGWGFWRGCLGWSSFGGSMDPQDAPTAWRELLRNAVSALFPMGALIWLGVPWPWAVVMMAIFAVAATVVALWYGVEAKKGHDVDPEVDALHGWLFGLAAAVAILTISPGIFSRTY